MEMEQQQMSVSDTPRRAEIRKAFEEWVKSRGEHPLKSCGAVYLDDSHRDMWEGWEAATGVLSWISAAERLPPFGEKVLALSVDGPEAGRLVSVMNDKAIFEICGEMKFTATHWMPLPGLPS